MNFTINTIGELNQVADEIIQLSKTNSVFCFYGNLGSGKTTLIKLICEKLNVIDNVSSPTYPIINEYKSAGNNTIYHIDLYRLKSIEEAMDIGIEEYFHSNHLCFIEWPDHFESILPDKHVKIKISKFDESRKIVLTTWTSMLGKIKTEYSLYTKEVLAEIGNNRKPLFIGIPKETDYQEKRTPLTPNSVAALVNYGFRIRIEQGAGESSNFTDDEYLNAGADIVHTKDDVFKAEMILKSGPVNQSEIGLLHNSQVIFSPILLPSQTKNMIKTMMEKRITAIAFEYMKGDFNTYPFMRSMSEIAGNYAILTAAKYLSNEYGSGILLGSIAGQPPAKVLILGAGTVGEYAAKVALALGASVQIFDDNIYHLARLQRNLGQKIYTSVIDPINLAKNISRAHVVIGALKPKNGRTPKVVTEDMVRSMKKGSVIIDVSIDHGGCFETSMVTNHNEPVYTKYNVIHYCVPNIASNVSRTASYSLSNILSPVLKNAANVGGVENLLKLDSNFRHGAYLYKGALTKEFIAKKFDLKFTDLQLLMSADF